MIDRRRFLDWLREQGADVQASTNPYEFARFQARNGVHIIYRRRDGTFNPVSGDGSNFALQCLAAFQRGAAVAMGFAKKRNHIPPPLVRALLDRDGPACFFCLENTTEENRTVEHLVAKMRGGTDHTDNLVLAHEACNHEAGKETLRDKIRRHVEAQLRQTVPAPPG